MENYNKAEILQMVEEEDVEFIRLQFTDMFGVLKNVAIPASRIIKAMDNRCTIDLASLDGFAQREETDLYLKPDLATFSILPWRPSQAAMRGCEARFRLPIAFLNLTGVCQIPSVCESSKMKSYRYTDKSCKTKV